MFGGPSFLKKKGFVILSGAFILLYFFRTITSGFRTDLFVLILPEDTGL